jgi:hypothetical protein
MKALFLVQPVEAQAAYEKTVIVPSLHTVLPQLLAAVGQQDLALVVVLSSPMLPVLLLVPGPVTLAASAPSWRSCGTSPTAAQQCPGDWPASGPGPLGMHLGKPTESSQATWGEGVGHCAGSFCTLNMFA